MLFDRYGFSCDRPVQRLRVKQQRSLGKRRENLEGLWGELASSFTNMGGSEEATLLAYNLQPTDETLYEKTYGNLCRFADRCSRLGFPHP